MTLPVSAFWPTFKIAKFDDGTKNITSTFRVFKVEELNVVVANWAWEVIDWNILRKVTLKSLAQFMFAQGWAVRQGGSLWKQHARPSPSDGRPELNSGKLNDHTSMPKKSWINPVVAVGHTEDIHIQSILLLYSLSNLSLSWKYVFQKLMYSLALHW